MGPGTLTAQFPKSLKGVVPCVEGRRGAGVRPAVACPSRCRTNAPGWAGAGHVGQSWAALTSHERGSPVLVL